MEDQTLTRQHLQRFIQERRIDAVVLPMNEHTSTVAEAARALGVETDRIVKTLVFLKDDEPILVINNGLARVDRSRLAVFFGVGRKRVKFATPGQALSITGFVVGSMPPFGHKQRLRTLVDPAVTRMDVVYGGGGSVDAMMRLTSRELLRVTEAEVVALSEPMAPERLPSPEGK